LFGGNSLEERAMAIVDTGEVLMTGENSFVRLSHDGGKTLSERTSHWRVLWCPAGAGHALFMTGDLTDNVVRIFSDNAGVARWLQESIESVLFPGFADTSTPIIPALFAREGDPRGTVSELIESDAEVIRLTWWDILDPFILNAAASETGRPISVYSAFFPARSAQLSIDDQVATGQPWLEAREDRQSSSAVIALSESWVRPS
jgi:hypothetical protein